MIHVPIEVRHAWRQHAAVDRALIETLEASVMTLPTPGGGWTVEQQLAHAAAATAFWSGAYDPASAEGLKRFHPDEPPRDAFAHDPAKALDYTDRANDAALRAAEAVASVEDRAHESGTSLLAHMMVHAAHHRAQVMLALKAAGRALPGDDSIWGPWKLADDA